MLRMVMAATATLRLLPNMPLTIANMPNPFTPAAFFGAMRQYRMTTSPLPGTRAVLLLLWLTLLASALHFADNVWYFNEYPEPAWLSPGVVGALWLPLAWLAARAWRCARQGEWARSHLLIHGFVSGNMLSLGHYLFAAPWLIAPRINAAIALQVGMAFVLLAATLRQQARSAPSTLRSSARVWLENVGLLVLLVAVLEWFWPSRFSLWWLPGAGAA